MGSRARGNFHEYSDYDILIIGDLSLDSELKLEYELEKLLHKEVDVIKLTNETDRILLKNILNEAIVFLDKNGSYEEVYNRVEEFFIENGDFIKLRERDLFG